MNKTIRSRDSWELIVHLAKEQHTDAVIAVLKTLITNTVLLLRFQSEPIEELQLRIPSPNVLETLQTLDAEIQELVKAGQFEAAYLLFESYVKCIARLAGVSSLSLRGKLIGGMLQEQFQTQLSIKLGLSALKRRRRSGAGLTYGAAIASGTPFERDSDDVEGTKLYYTTYEVADKLGVTPQTVRRMVELKKFPGAVQTDGGHWRIPQELFKTTKEQDRRAEDALTQLDKKVMDAGEFDEFNL